MSKIKSGFIQKNVTHIDKVLWMCCLLLPIFASTLYFQFEADFINVSNWKVYLISRLITTFILIIGILFFIYKYFQAINKTKSPKKERKNIFIGLLAFLIFFIFLSPFKSFLDLIEGPKSYFGTCRVIDNDSYRYYQPAHVMLPTNPKLSLKVSRKFYRVLATEYGGGPCLSLVHITYLSNSKVVLNVQD